MPYKCVFTVEATIRDVFVSNHKLLNAREVISCERKPMNEKKFKILYITYRLKTTSHIEHVI